MSHQIKYDLSDIFTTHSSFERFNAPGIAGHHSFLLANNQIATCIIFNQHVISLPELAPLEITLYLLPVQYPQRELFPDSNESGSIEASTRESLLARASIVSGLE